MSYGNKIADFSLLDELSGMQTFIHKLKPEIKIIITILYIGLVVSFGKYEVKRLLPFFIYPVVMMQLADIPFHLLLRKMLPALFFILVLGIFNPVFEPGGAGWLSLSSLMLKAVMTVSAGLILVSVTGMDGIGAGLRSLRVPAIFASQLLMVYRYIFVLSEEASRLLTSYSLRSFRNRAALSAVSVRDSGSFLGSLILRSFNRSERIYAAMKCRGYNSDGAGMNMRRRIKTSDILFLLAAGAILIAIKIIDVPVLFEKLMEGLL